MLTVSLDITGRNVAMRRQWEYKWRWPKSVNRRISSRLMGAESVGEKKVRAIEMQHKVSAGGAAGKGRPRRGVADMMARWMDGCEWLVPGVSWLLVMAAGQCLSGCRCS